MEDYIVGLQFAGGGRITIGLHNDPVAIKRLALRPSGVLKTLAARAFPTGLDLGHIRLTSIWIDRAGDASPEAS